MALSVALVARAMREQEEEKEQEQEPIGHGSVHGHRRRLVEAGGEGLTKNSWVQRAKP
jgi:hypothetical protein